MLKYSVQSKLYAILYVDQNLQYPIPMYAVVDKDTINFEIIPYLSTAKRGFNTKSSLTEVVNAILYKFKTGCQWRQLPVEALFSEVVLGWNAVYHHFRKWSVAGEWKQWWTDLLDRHRDKLDLSSVDLDGSHTVAKKGGAEVGYQKRKHAKTTNALYLTDRQGLPIAMSNPKSGEHHDVHEIDKAMDQIIGNLAKSNISLDGIFMNADAGFDCDVFRERCKKEGIVANICIHKRRKDTDDIYVDDVLYAERYSVERSNAWMDSFRSVMNRFDTTVQSWTAWNYLAFGVILLNKILRKQKV